MELRKICAILLVFFICLIPLSSVLAGGKKAEEAMEEEKLPEAKAIPSVKEANIDWDQFKGDTLAIVLSVHPWQEAIDPYLPDFEKLTGMKLKTVKIPEHEFMTKVAAELTAGTFAFDVYMTQYYDSPKYQLEGWTADLKPLMNNSKITDLQWYDWDDFFPAAQNIATVGGKYFDRIAITAEAQVLIYREDVYEDLGLSVPETFDELLANARAINEKTDMAGITQRGDLYCWWPMYGVVLSYGGGYFAGPSHNILNVPWENVLAFRAAIEKYRDYPLKF